MGIVDLITPWGIRLDGQLDRPNLSTAPIGLRTPQKLLYHPTIYLNNILYKSNEISPHYGIFSLLLNTTYGHEESHFFNRNNFYEFCWINTILFYGSMKPMSYSFSKLHLTWLRRGVLFCPAVSSTSCKAPGTPQSPI